MAVVQGALQITGLKESIAGMRQANRDLPKVIARESKRVTADLVLPDARKNIGAAPVPKNDSMVIASAVGGGAALILKYSKYPWAAGAEFGAKQFKQFRSFNPSGYIVQPAIEDNLGRIAVAWLDAVSDAIRKWVA